MTPLVLLLYSIAAGLAYRLGGYGKGLHLVKVFVFPLILVLMVCQQFGFAHPFMALISYALTCAATSTYTYGMKKPPEYSAINYAFHSLIICLAFLPLAYSFDLYCLMSVRAAFVPEAVAVWFLMASRDDNAHEFGRGFIIAASLSLLSP